MKIDMENAAKDAEKEASRQARAGQTRTGYRGANRGDDSDDEEESKIEDSGKERVLENYLKVVSKNTKFFSTEKADIIF
jgi:hypothetical protein